MIAENLSGPGPNSAEVIGTPESSPISEEEMQASTLAFSNPAGSGGSLTMAIGGSVLGHAYQIQRSPDLAAETWINVDDARAGTGGAIDVVLPLQLSEDKGFYRIKITR